MKEELVTFETAKLAKEKGFKTKIIGTFNGNHYYNYKGELDGDQLEIIKNIDNPNPLFANIAAPTQSLLQRWLREKHNTHITIRCKRTDSSLDGFWHIIYSMESKMFKTYEEALEDALYKSMILI